MSSLRQRAIEVASAAICGKYRTADGGTWCNWCEEDAESAVDALIAAGLIRDETPVHQLAAWADAGGHRVEITRSHMAREWIVMQMAHDGLAWQPSIDAAAQYALDRIAEGGDS